MVVDDVLLPREIEALEKELKCLDEAALMSETIQVVFIPPFHNSACMQLRGVLLVFVTTPARDLRTFQNVNVLLSRRIW